MKTQFAVLSALAAAICMTTQECLALKFAVQTDANSCLAAQTQSETMLLGYDDALTQEDGSLDLSQTEAFAEKTDAEWTQMFNSMMTKAKKKSEDLTPYSEQWAADMLKNHDETVGTPPFYKRWEFQFNAANGIALANTGGRDHSMLQSNKRTKYPKKKYDGHGIGVDDWKAFELGRVFTEATKALAEDDDFKPNVDNKFHIVHVICGKGEGKISDATKEKIDAELTAGTIVDYWYKPDEPIIPAFFILFEKPAKAVEDAPNVESAPEAFPSLGEPAPGGKKGKGGPKAGAKTPTK